jgi:hypothetical protein
MNGKGDCIVTAFALIMKSNIVNVDKIKVNFFFIRQAKLIAIVNVLQHT